MFFSIFVIFVANTAYAVVATAVVAAAAVAAAAAATYFYYCFISFFISLSLLLSFGSGAETSPVPLR